LDVYSPYGRVRVLRAPLVAKFGGNRTSWRGSRYHPNAFPMLVMLLHDLKDRTRLAALLEEQYPGDAAAQAEIACRVDELETCTHLYEIALEDAARGTPTREHADRASRLMGLYRRLGRPNDAVRVYDTLLFPIARRFPGCSGDDFVANAFHARDIVARCGAVASTLAADAGERGGPFVTAPCLPAGGGEISAPDPHRGVRGACHG